MAKPAAGGRRPKRRERKNIAYGTAHIKSSFNNTIITFTDQSGNTKITSATVNGTQGDVVVNGGSQPVGRKDDPVSHGTLVVTAAMVAGVPVVTIVYTPGDGSAPQTAVSNASNTITLHEKILDGAQHFKA